MNVEGNVNLFLWALTGTKKQCIQSISSWQKETSLLVDLVITFNTLSIKDITLCIP